KLSNSRRPRRSRLWAGHIFLETLQYGGKTGAAADGHHAQLARTGGPQPWTGVGHGNLADLLDSFFGRQRKFGSRIGIEQFGETRVLGKILKIRVVTRLETQSSIQADRAGQIAQGILDVSGKTIERGKAVGHIICFGDLLGELFQVLASADVVSDVDE